MPDDVLYRKRLWLNPLHGRGDAYISAKLRRWTINEDSERPTETGLEGNVYITDCNRKISLEFNESRDDVKKLNKMIRVLTEFREALEATAGG